MSTQSQQTEKAYKKSTLNVAMTGLGGSAFFTEPPSPTVVFASNIVVDDTLIPSAAPTSSLVNGTKFNQYGNVTTGEDAIIMYNEATMNAYPGSSNASYVLSSFEGLIIPFNFADGSYSPKIYANTVAGSQLPFGLNGWEFDPAAGVVTFFQGKPASVTNNTLGIKFWTYVGPRGIQNSDVQIEKRSFVLSDRNNPPADVTWSAVNNEWTITHNLNSTELQIDYRVNGFDNSILTQIVDVNTLKAVLQPVKNKTLNTVSYPTDVLLTVRKL